MKQKGKITFKSLSLTVQTAEAEKDKEITSFLKEFLE